jgi:uncharacterized protein YkwD
MHRLTAPALAVALLILAALVAQFESATTSAGTPTAAAGDANCDGAVNSIDAALVLQYSAGLIGSLSCQGLADVNYSSSVSAVDAALILQFSAGLISQLPASKGEAPTEYQDYDKANAVLASINSARAAQGIAALSANGALTAAVESYAQLLTQLNTLSHDLNGGVLARIQASGYTGGFFGETLWEGLGRSYTADEVVNDWLNSPPHRVVLLSTTYVDAGVACYVKEVNGAPNTRCVLDVGAP